MTHYTRTYKGTKAQKTAQGLKDLIEYKGKTQIKKLISYLKSIPSPKTRYRQAQFMLGIAGVRSYWSTRAVIEESYK
jgi:hypothetical protein